MIRVEGIASDVTSRSDVPELWCRGCSISWLNSDLQSKFDDDDDDGDDNDGDD
jgi:hypothetical protein